MIILVGSFFFFFPSFLFWLTNSQDIMIIFSVDEHVHDLAFHMSSLGSISVIPDFLFLLFVPGSMMKTSSKTNSKVDPGKTCLKCASRLEALPIAPIAWSISTYLLRGYFWNWQLSRNLSTFYFSKNSPSGPLYEMLYSGPKRWDPENCLSAENHFCYKTKSTLN